MDDRSPPEKPSSTEELKRRPVRSFVLRKGRVTEGQRRALEELWPVFGLEPEGGVIDFADAFGNQLPVILEIGFGNGDATWQMAAAEPENNFLGAEVHRPGVGHLLLKVEEHGLQNIRIACEDAVELLNERVQDGSLAGVRIYFPDPWHKKRHHKRRIVNSRFRDLIYNALKPGAVIHIATDWQDYAEWIAEQFLADERFDNQGNAEGYAACPSYRPLTRFEQRGRRLGHGVWDLLFAKRRCSS